MFGLREYVRLVNSHYQLLVANCCAGSTLLRYGIKYLDMFNVHGTVHRGVIFYITNEMQLTQCSLLLSSALYMFRAVFPPIIRSS